MEKDKSIKRLDNRCFKPEAVRLEHPPKQQRIQESTTSQALCVTPTKPKTQNATHKHLRAQQKANIDSGTLCMRCQTKTRGHTPRGLSYSVENVV